MRIILLNDLRQTGRRGEEVDVKPGYARNYLIPKGLAVEATEGNRKWFEHQREKLEAKAAQDREEAQAIAERLDSFRVEIVKRVGETETLYGSVTSSEIADALAEEGIEVERRKIDIGEGIKSVGDHSVTIYLHPEVTAEIVVSVVAMEE